MRYLWVEDFDGDKDRQEKIKTWTDYFGLNFSHDCILMTTLEDALEYLDKHYAEHNFDAVLLDIRFPIRKYESKLKDDKAVHENWFSRDTRVPIEKFEEYTRAGLTKAADASSGILLFQALVQKYGYSWRKIAFLSANVDHGEMSHVNFLEQTLARIRFTGDWDLIDPQDKSKSASWINYRTQYVNIHDEIDEGDSEELKKLLDGIRCIAPSELRKLKKTHDLDVIKKGIEGLYKIRRQKNNEDFAKHSNDLKYSSVFGHFEDLSSETPPAFVKPPTGCEHCWTFLEWKQTLMTPYTIARRGIIDICDFLIARLSKNMLPPRKDWYSYYGIGKSDVELRAMLLDEYFSIIRSLAINLPDDPSCDPGNHRLFQLVKTIVGRWESKGFISSCVNLNVHYNILRATRNWTHHPDVLTSDKLDIRMTVFVFLLSVQGIFDNNIFKDKDYLDAEEALLDGVFGKTTVAYDNIKNIEGDENTSIVEKAYHALFKRADADYDKMPYTAQDKIAPQVPCLEPRNPYYSTNVLGNEANPNRHKVTSKDLYRLFWLDAHYIQVSVQNQELRRSQRPHKTANPRWKRLLEKTYALVFQNS